MHHLTELELSSNKGITDIGGTTILAQLQFSNIKLISIGFQYGHW